MSGCVSCTCSTYVSKNKSEVLKRTEVLAILIRQRLIFICTYDLVISGSHQSALLNKNKLWLANLQNKSCILEPTDIL